MISAVAISLFTGGLALANQVVCPENYHVRAYFTESNVTPDARYNLICSNGKSLLNPNTKTQTIKLPYDQKTGKVGFKMPQQGSEWTPVPSSNPQLGGALVCTPANNADQCAIQLDK